MTVKKYLLFFIFYWCLCLKTTAQTQDFGFVSPTPNTLKWKQLNNDTLRIIYPPDQEAYARQLAGNMLWQARNTSFSLGNHVQKINVVLHTENAQSNGYVGLAPFRSEFYLTPLHQTNQLGSIDFGKLLSIHEYRHVLQTANSLKGFSKFLYFISGERGWTAYHYLSTPAWFFEGDAVLTETAFTKQGRGRIPTFLNDYRFLALGNSMYSYQKARNGSLKDFVPDHYRLGYMLCRNGLDEYGKDFWTQVYDHTNRGNPLLFSFKRNFKKQSGVSLTSFYNQTINKYYGNWLKDTLISQNNYARQINQEAKVFTTYSYPQFVDNHQLIVLKKSFDKNPEFIFIDLEGNEESIVKSGISSDTYFHYANQKIVYTEVRYHLRYQNKNYNEIILVDANTKIKKQITNQTKTFAPSLNADASKIIAMEFKENQTSALVVYNLQGKKLTEISVNNYYYTFPKFINDNEAVSAVRDSSGNMSIALIDLITTKHTLLFSPTNNIISDLSYANQQLFFTASFNGKDQLFVFDLTENKLYRTLQRVNYAYMPTVNSADDIIAFTELNPKGRQLMVSELNKFNREEIRVLELHKLQGFQSKNFNSINQEIKSLQSPFIVKDYNRNRFLF
ncbi:MAG: hypothetical protein IT239_07170, partial [Bacteroidia bacterium]|nr:hypothetical protein [Bacteroidia bacterium]